jgi:hypothetical protein
MKALPLTMAAFLFATSGVASAATATTQQAQQSATMHLAQSSMTRTVVIGFVACRTKDLFLRALSMAQSDDWTAVAKMVLQGQCIQLEKGETVYLEDATWTGALKVRKRGSTRAYWTAKEFID